MEITPEQILEFKGGLIGFPDYDRYVLLPFMEGTEFELLQSVDHGNLGFVVVDPFLFRKDYEFEINDSEQEELKAESPDDLRIRVIVTIPEDPKEMTANLQGPIIVNQKGQVGKQIILHDSDYSTKYRIFPDSE